MFGKRGKAHHVVLLIYIWMVLVLYHMLLLGTLIGLDHEACCIEQITSGHNWKTILAVWLVGLPGRQTRRFFQYFEPQITKPNEHATEPVFHARSVALNWIFPFLHNISWRKHLLSQKSTGVVHVCCKSDKSSSNLKAFSRKPQSSPSKRSWENKNQGIITWRAISRNL